MSDPSDVLSYTFMMQPLLHPSHHDSELVHLAQWMTIQKLLRAAVTGILNPWVLKYPVGRYIVAGCFLPTR